MLRLYFLCLLSCLASFAPLFAQRGCCDNNFNAGNKALNAKNYSEAIRFFTQGNGCGDKCSHDFAVLIKQVKNAEKAAATSKPRPKSEPSTPSVSTSFTAPQMVEVEGGSFQMGDDAYSYSKPAHAVAVSSFYIGKYEVTQAEWRSVMGQNPKELTDFKGDNMPVHSVSWNDIQDFLQKINAKTGKKYRLPTEAEWEFAARGGNKSNNYTYSGANDVKSVAWMSENAGSKTHTVGGLKANELGIYDMSGNVWEWCQDWYKGYPGSSGVTDYTGSDRVNRGGSWFNGAGICRSAYRDNNTPASRFYSLGFRLAISSLQ